MEKLADACEQAAFEKDYDDSDGMDDYGDDEDDDDDDDLGEDGTEDDQGAEDDSYVDDRGFSISKRTLYQVKGNCSSMENQRTCSRAWQRHKM